MLSLRCWRSKNQVEVGASLLQDQSSMVTAPHENLRTLEFAEHSAHFCTTAKCGPLILLLTACLGHQSLKPLLEAAHQTPVTNHIGGEVRLGIVICTYSADASTVAFSVLLYLVYMFMILTIDHISDKICPQNHCSCKQKSQNNIRVLAQPPCRQVRNLVLALFPFPFPHTHLSHVQKQSFPELLDHSHLLTFSHLVVDA